MRMYLAYRVSRDDGNLACRVSLTRRAIYISACARARCRACPHPRIYARAARCSAEGCRGDGPRGGGGGWEGEHENTGGTRRLLSPCILAHYSGREPPPLSPPPPPTSPLVPHCPECHVVWLRTCLVLSRRGISASITRALHSCVRACVRACVRFGRAVRKIAFRVFTPAESERDKGGVAMSIFGVLWKSLRKYRTERNIAWQIRLWLFRRNIGCMRESSRFMLKLFNMNEPV